MQPWTDQSRCTRLAKKCRQMCDLFFYIFWAIFVYIENPLLYLQRDLPVCIVMIGGT